MVWAVPQASQFPKLQKSATHSQFATSKLLYSVWWFRIFGRREILPSRDQSEERFPHGQVIEGRVKLNA